MSSAPRFAGRLRCSRLRSGGASAGCFPWTGLGIIPSPMYDHLRGRIAVRKPTHLVIDVAGVGYRVDIPLSTYEAMPTSGEAMVYTYLKVAEDALRLYG